MELWIRSQDKKRLIKPTELFITIGKQLYNEEHNYIIMNEYETTLGTYSTERQALDVLDEIQKVIYQNIVYQMPEDKGEDYASLH